MIRAKSRARAYIAAALICVLTPTFATGCFGGFRLTKKVHRFNRTISYDRWIQWFTFLVFWLVPIYGISFAVDAIFANTIEFWSGTNPITVKAGETHVVRGPNSETVRTTRLSEREFRLEITAADGSVRTLTIVREDDSVVALDDAGEVLARVGDVDGQPGLVGGPLAQPQ